MRILVVVVVPFEKTFVFLESELLLRAGVTFRNEQAVGNRRRHQQKEKEVGEVLHRNLRLL
jgi:hypothetical protein